MSCRASGPRRRTGAGAREVSSATNPERSAPSSLHPYSHPYNWREGTAFAGRARDRGSRSARLRTLAGRWWQITQIYEGTNQIQRVVVARRLIEELAEH
jgi:alkylation response protein AidB-like acyl-CoA dehydrogenase